MSVLTDGYERQFSYLRLSITDVCNFRCFYCLPNGYVTSSKIFLNVAELRRVLTTFAELGIQKVRLCGGEPTCRKDFLDIANMISTIPGIKTRAFTTNGYKLKKFAHSYIQTGLNAITVSVDSLDPATFHKITQHDRLADVLAGINKAQEVGFTSIKVNAVLLKNINDHELENFLLWVKNKPITVRFIELMQTNGNNVYFDRHHLSPLKIQEQLRAIGWQEKQRSADAGPAVELTHPDYRGGIGFITPYAQNFCASCNRLRVSSEGNLHLCLFGDASHSLKPLLQSDSQKEELKQYILKSVQLKRQSHFLQQGDFGIVPNLASIGG